MIHGIVLLRETKDDTVVKPTLFTRIHSSVTHRGGKLPRVCHFISSILLFFVFTFVGAKAQPCFDPSTCWPVTITSENHIIIITASVIPLVNGSPLPNGSYIGVFFNDGGTLVCAGYSQWTGVNTSLSAFGDDADSPEKDGMTTGEVFQFKYL